MKMTEEKRVGIRDYLFDVNKIIDGALAADAEKVVAYVERLRDRLAEAGESEAARRLDQKLKRQGTRSVGFARANGAIGRLPVDSESRLPIADEEYIDSLDAEPVLQQEVSHSVERFIRYVRLADELAANGVGIAGSLLLYGPPGCGKTMLARYIAMQLGLPLITARTDSLISSYLGSTAKNLRLLFDHAMARPCVLFLDEFDALGKMRDDSRELGELKRVVISLLQNIDAMGPDHVLLAATNHEHLLDRAIWRRFSYKLPLALPNSREREQIIAQYLRGHGQEDAARLFATISEGLSGAELREICDDAVRAAVIERTDDVLAPTFLTSVMQARPDSPAWVAMSPAEKVAHLNTTTHSRLTQKQLGRLAGVSQSSVSKFLRSEVTDA